MLENYDIRPEIIELAYLVLDVEERAIAIKIIDYYLKPKKRVMAISILKSIVPVRPKRPLYYINHEVKFLNQNSRWIAENIGSYLDLLVKELRLEIEGSYYKQPLGRNISYLLKSGIDESIKKTLNKVLFFNKIVYVPAKHEYEPAFIKRHYFSIPDIILILLSGVKLGEELKKNSLFASNLAQDLCLPGQKPYIGIQREPDGFGKPFDFKLKLIDTITLIDKLMSTKRNHYKE